MTVRLLSLLCRVSRECTVGVYTILAILLYLWANTPACFSTSLLWLKIPNFFTFLLEIIMTGEPNLRRHTPEYINYHLKSKVAITLCWQLRSTHYHPVWSEKYLKSNCVINVASIKYRIFLLRRGNHHMQPPKWHFSLSVKMNGTQRRALSWRMYCTYCSMPKGTSWAKATSNSEKIKHIALAIVELRWSEGIRQAGS